MDNEISVLIADDNIELGNVLNNYINQQTGIHVTGVARDGLQAMDMIRSLTPDVVVLDIIMPNLDGIGVLERIPSLGLEQPPVFFMLSAIGQDSFVRIAVELGAKYFIVKPFNLDLLILRIKQIYNEKTNSPVSYGNIIHPMLIPERSIKIRPKRIKHARNLEAEAAAFMNYIGIPPHMKGYRYIKEALVGMVNNPNPCGFMSRIIYPLIAEKFNVKSKKVERCIRSAIAAAWAKKILPGFFHGHNGKKPSNCEIIAMMVGILRMPGRKR